MLITCPKCSAKYQIPPEIKLVNGKKMQCSACEHIFEFQSKVQENLIKSPSLQPPADAVLSFDSKVEQITVKTTEALPSATQPALPEVFRPIQTKTSTKGLPYFWIMLSLLLVIGLMLMGWLWRDLLLLKNQNFPFAPTPFSVRVHKMPVTTVSQPTISIPLFVDETLSNLPQEAPPASLKPSVQSVRFRKTPTGEAVLIEGVLKNTTSETLPVPEKIYALAYDTKGSLAFEKEIYLPTGVLPPDAEQPFFGTYTPAVEEIQWVDVVLEK